LDSQEANQPKQGKQQQRKWKNDVTGNCAEKEKRLRQNTVHYLPSELR
jgi:hypothetical protein